MLPNFLCFYLVCMENKLLSGTRHPNMDALLIIQTCYGKSEMVTFQINHIFEHDRNTSVMSKS